MQAKYPEPPLELSGTRERILKASLALLNQRSLAKVTTAELAAAAGMAEGNLHYHFRRKADLLAALYDGFESDARRLAERSLQEISDAPALVDYQRDWFRLMWRHRWCYKDASSLFAMVPALRPRLKANTIRLRQTLLSRLAGMVRDGHLRATDDEELQRLLTNVWIISLFWINYLSLLMGAALEEADLDWGFSQVLALWAPHLNAAGREYAATIIRQTNPDPLAAQRARGPRGAKT